jgi:ATP-dependent Clp protease ATP-binding subunit ClpC
LSIDEIESQAMSELRRLFNPEFLNRVDDVVVFQPLDMKQIEAIFDLETAELSRRLAERGCGLRLLPAARRILIEKGWDPRFGGRPLRRTIQKELEDPLSRLMLAENRISGTVFTADGRKGKIHLTARKPACGESAASPQAVSQEALDNSIENYPVLL